MLNLLLEQSDVVKALLNAKDAEVLEGYVTEMLRIDPPLQGIYREAKANEVVGSTSIKAGDLVYLDVTTANKNVSFQFLFSSRKRLSWYFRSKRLWNPRRSITHVLRSITFVAMF